MVSINIEINTYDYFNQLVKEEGVGLGWIIRSDGYIVTNNHVVASSDNLTVTYWRGDTKRTTAITLTEPPLAQ
jgi:S1-C subfamily serine protease